MNAQFWSEVVGATAQGLLFPLVLTRFSVLKATRWLKFPTFRILAANGWVGVLGFLSGAHSLMTRDHGNPVIVLTMLTSPLICLLFAVYDLATKRRRFAADAKPFLDSLAASDAPPAWE